MGIKNFIFGAVALAAIAACSQVSQAQTSNAIVVTTCGTPPSTYSAGTSRPITQDTNGNGCSSASVSVGSVTISPVTPVSTAALAANLVVSATASTLHSFNVSADSTLSGAAWWVMVYNLAAAPADGAVTPTKCYALPSGTTSLSGAFVAPDTFGTGIVIGVSTTGCFTKTASTHAFISGD